MNIVEKQLEMWNIQDLEGFLDCYTSDIQVFMLQSGQKLADGIDNLREVMAPTFGQDSEGRTHVLTSLQQGNLIVNHEKITGHTRGKIIFTISIYEITDDKISKLWFGGRTMVDE